jgi:N-sulfoglucosamine sulfohydrolase
MLQISRFNPIGISLIIALALTLHAHAKPNILFITVDDMNADSVGCFGCPIEGTTPNLDQLAADGIRFEHAHVQVPNCTPSRNVLQTGRYPQNNGVEGFYDVVVEFPDTPGPVKGEWLSDWHLGQGRRYHTHL